MTNKSIQIQNGSLRELRLEKGLTQLQVAEEARLSENSVANAENGRPVSKRTVREIIKALDVTAELLCVDAERGLYTITKNSKPPTGHEILKFMSNELGGASTAEEFKSKLEIILKLAGVKQAFISELFERSLHWSMEVPEEAADKLRSLFAANEDGELVIDKGSLVRALAKVASIEPESELIEAGSPSHGVGPGSLWLQVMPTVTLALGVSLVLFLTYCFSQLAKPQLVVKPQLLTPPSPFMLLNRELQLQLTENEGRVSLWLTQASKLRQVDKELTASLKAFIDAPTDSSLEISLLRAKLLEARAILSESRSASQKIMNQVPDSFESPDVDVRPLADIRPLSQFSNSSPASAESFGELFAAELRAAQTRLEETIALAEGYLKPKALIK